MDSEVVMWLRFAKTDLGVAEHLDKEYYPKPFEIICYHCQQAAEKAVKALIIALDIPGGIPKKHNLTFLLSQIRNYVKIPEKFFDYTDSLTPYGIAVRYPGELQIEDFHVREALVYAREIVAWAENNISQLS